MSVQIHGNGWRCTTIGDDLILVSNTKVIKTLVSSNVFGAFSATTSVFSQTSNLPFIHGLTHSRYQMNVKTLTVRLYQTMPASLYLSICLQKRCFGRKNGANESIMTHEDRTVEEFVETNRVNVELV